jgi:hypothetical protein
LPGYVRESFQHLGGRHVAHGLGQGGEAAKVDEDNRRPQLTGHFTLLQEPRLLGHLRRDVLSQCLQKRLAMEVEDGRFDQRLRLLGNGISAVLHLQGLGSGRSQRLMHIEVEQALGRLRCSSHRVRIDPQELHKGLLGKAGLQGHPDAPQRLDVPVVKRLALVP